MKNYNNNYLACILFMLTVLTSPSDATAKEPVTVTVMSADSRPLSKQYSFTGMVDFAAIYEIAATTEGMLIDVPWKTGELMPDKALLYKLDKNEPGYSELHQYNPFGTRQIVNIFQETGRYVKKGDVIMHMASPNDFKVTVKVTAEEANLFRHGKQLTIELAPGTQFARSIRSYKHRLQAPINRKPFYNLEVFFNCNQQPCLHPNVQGETARITGNWQDHNVIQVPVNWLRDGMSSIWTLEDDGHIRQRRVSVISATEEFALLPADTIRGASIIIDTSQSMKPGSKPDNVVRL